MEHLNFCNDMRNYWKCVSCNNKYNIPAHSINWTTVDNQDFLKHITRHSLFTLSPVIFHPVSNIKAPNEDFTLQPKLIS